MTIQRYRLRLLAPLVILALLTSGAGSIALAAQTATGVATFHGDAARTGEQPGPAPEGAPSLAWQFETGGTVRSSPVIADGALYIGSSDGFLYALDAVNGTEQWRFETGGRITGAAAVADGGVYVGSADGYVYAIDATSGEQRWRFFAAELGFNPTRVIEEDRNRGSLTSSVAVVDGLVIVTSNSFKITAIDAANGIEQWHGYVTSDEATTPSVADDQVFVASASGIQAFDLQTGSPLWEALFAPDDNGSISIEVPSSASEPASSGSSDSAEADSTEAAEDAASTEEGSDEPADGFAVQPTLLDAEEVPLAEIIGEQYEGFNWTVAAAPVVVGDRLFVVVFGSSASTEGRDSRSAAVVTSGMLSLNRENGLANGVWPFYAWEPTLTTPAIVNDSAFVGGDQGLLYAFDVEAGGERWGVQTEAAIASSPVVADETVFFGNDDGTIFALATETGVEQWRFATGGPVRSSPVVLDGLVYVGSDDGSVYAIGGS